MVSRDSLLWSVLAHVLTVLLLFFMPQPAPPREMPSKPLTVNLIQAPKARPETHATKPVHKPAPEPPKHVEPRPEAAEMPLLLPPPPPPPPREPIRQEIKPEPPKPEPPKKEPPRKEPPKPEPPKKEPPKPEPPKPEPPKKEPPKPVKIEEVKREPPKKEPPKKEEPKKEHPLPKKEEAKRELPKEEPKKKEPPKKEEPKKEPPKKEPPKKEEPKKEPPKKEEPKKEPPKKEEPKKEPPKKEEPKKEPPKKEEPKKAPAKADETKKREPKKDESEWSDITKMIQDDFAGTSTREPPPKPLPPAVTPAPPQKPAPAQQAPAQAQAPAQGPPVSRLQVEMYKQAIERQVRTSWNKPTGMLDEDRLAVTVRAKVAPDGRLFNPQIVRASGAEVFDRSVLSAIHKAQDLPQPPAGCQECLDIVFVFRASDNF
ncbi:MAG: TonB C-terminal domain-containing protein [Magnetococcales bacterium]|nr:TonB C-terminal domain-containing protein [Magnetococcales bacterium]